MSSEVTTVTNLKFYESLFDHTNNGEEENVINGALPDEFLSLNENLQEVNEKKNFQLQRLVSEECLEIQHNEMLAVMAIFESEITVTNSESKSFKINLRKTDNIDDSMDIWFSVPLNYPNDLPIFEIESNGTLSFHKADELYDLLLEEACNLRHETMIYKLVEVAKDYLDKNVPIKPIEKLETEEDIIEEDYDDEESKLQYHHMWTYKPTMFTGPIHKIIDSIPADLQIVSIENILRNDLVTRYQSCKEEFHNKYFSKSRNNNKEYFTDSTLGFHGTSSRNMNSIVRTGLKVPGEESGISIAHGTNYGVGIYLSPNPSFSLSYADDASTLLVCSVLLGRCLKMNERKSYEGKVRYDSVMSSNGDEMVFFRAAQVLPCFVIKLAYKFRRDDATNEHNIEGSYASSIAKAKRENETGDEKKQRVTKRASKYLPFGYGPSNKVLDVANSSDDEEEYGNFQECRNPYFDNDPDC